jgi:ParB family chromosome partitioning protein
MSLQAVSLGHPSAPPKRDLERSLFLLPIDSIRPNPDQPRRAFRREELQELTISIAQVGLIQPLTVRPAGEGYELISGERRLRACQLLGLREVPCIVEQADAEKSALMALVENVQRSDLSFWEEAEGYRRLLTVYGLSREELCRRIGKSPAFLSNKLRLLKLSPAVRAAAEQGALSERHARCLLALETEAEQMQLIERILKEGWSVRQAEACVEKSVSRPKPLRVLRLTRDCRLFLNGLNTLLDQLRRAGMGVELVTDKRSDGLDVTIHIQTK